MLEETFDELCIFILQMPEHQLLYRLVENIRADKNTRSDIHVDEKIQKGPMIQKERKLWEIEMQC